MKRIVAAVALLGSALLLSACSGSITIDAPAAVPQADVEKTVSEELTANAGVAPDSVTCPGDLAATVGTVMRCSLTAGPDTLGVTVTVTAVNGTKVEYTSEVDAEVSPAP